jgi:hypothetical protein
MTKTLSGEVLDPEHDYNNETLSAKDFMLAVMRDTRLPIVTRLDAASRVAVYEHPRLAQVNQDVNAGITIRIEGGLPDLPGTNIIMPNGSSRPSVSQSEAAPDTPAPARNGRDTE